MYTLGGSHGGYIQAKLVEDNRINSLIKCSVIFNPVIYPQLMTICTDINDWPFCVFLGINKDFSNKV